MEIKLRQRLIGGIVIAALAIIFLPLLFKNSAPAQKQVTVDAPIPAAPPKPALQQTVMLMPGEDNTKQTANIAATTTQSQQPSQANSEQSNSTQNLTKNSPTQIAFGDEPISKSTKVATNNSVASTAQPQADKTASNTASAVSSASDEDMAETPVKKTATDTKNNSVKQNVATNHHKFSHHDETPLATKTKKLVVSDDASVTTPATKKTAITAAKTTDLKTHKGSAWVVQLGSFDKVEHAKNLVKELRSKGFKAFTREAKTSKGTMTKVLVGPEVKREKALALEEKINKEMKIKGILTSFNPLEAK